MRDKLKLKLNKDELTIEEGDATFLGKLIEGTHGKVRINNPRIHREIHKIKDSAGRVFKDDKHPENVGKIEKPKKK